MISRKSTPKDIRGKGFEKLGESKYNVTVVKLGGKTLITLLRRFFIKDFENYKDAEVRRGYGTLCSIVGIMLNILLFAGKYFAGVVTNSIAITADAFNNLSDAGSSVMTLIGFKFAGKKADKDHPFGHGRIEYIAGLGVSLAILLMGFELAKGSVEKIMNPEPVDTSILAICILIASIAVKSYMCIYNTRIGEKISSAAMKATGMDSLSDSIATSVVLISILVTKFTGVMIDGWCGVLVAAFIFWAGINAAKETIGPLLGQPPEPEFVQEIEDIVMAHKYIQGIHDLVVHDYGPGRLMISLHAEVPGDEDIFELHDEIDDIEMELNDKLNCESVIHMDPIETNNEAVQSKKAKVVEIIKTYDEEITIHDFRMNQGPTHTNLIFDAVLPAGYKKSPEVANDELSKLIQSQMPGCYAVIKMDISYV